MHVQMSKPAYHQVLHNIFNRIIQLKNNCFTLTQVGYLTMPHLAESFLIK